MGNELKLFQEEPAKLIVNRRAIAAGLASLMAVPTAAVAGALGKLSNVPLEFDASDFAMEMRKGLFKPNYRKPMVRVVFEDGTTTQWHRYDCVWRGGTARRIKAIAIETCAPDKNGMPRFTQLSIG